MLNVVRIRRGDYAGLAAYIVDAQNGIWKIFIPGAEVVAQVDNPLEMLSYEGVVVSMQPHENSIFNREWALGNFELLTVPEPVVEETPEEVPVGVEAEEFVEDLLAANQNLATEELIARAFPDNDRRFDDIIPGAIGSRLAGALHELIPIAAEERISEFRQAIIDQELRQQRAVPIVPDTNPEEYPDAAGFAIIRKRNDNGEPVPFFGYRCWWTADYPVPGIARPYPRYLVRVIMPPGHPQHGREIYRNYFEPDLEMEARTPEEWGRVTTLPGNATTLRLVDLINDSDNEWPRAI